MFVSDRHLLDARVGRARLWPAWLLLALLPGCLVTAENDIFGSDRNYTNGFRGLHSFERPQPGSAEHDALNGLQRRASELSESLDLFELEVPHDNTRRTHVGLVFGQVIFTPENLTTERLILDDRPYAGWLYTGLVHTTSLFDDDDTRRRDEQAYVELDIGVVGPLSYAEQTQTIVHRAINADVAKGWDNQLHNEAALLLRVGRQSRDAYWNDGGAWSGDSISGWQLNAGNVAVSALLGNTWRWGYELPRTFALGVGERSTATGNLNGAPDSIYGFFGVDGRAVLRDIFLDGNSFRDSHSVSKQNFVGAARAGIAWHSGNWFLAFAHERRTREFEEQRSNGHAFSSISAGYRLGR
ncbi:MAG: membrane protein [Planctomycetota bacterium]|nr:MAG: membrane protein [Planctomycetota bacterium]